MKKLFLLLSLVVAFAACKKETTTTTPPPTSTPTSLTITFTDTLGNTASGVSVYLYSSLADWTNKTNQVGTTKISGSNGKVSFSDLSAIKYYWYAELGCQNNYNGIYTTSILTSNTDNTVTTALASTGTLQLISTSSNPYGIYFNGTYQFDMAGGATKYVYNLPKGSISVRVLQLSGYVLYPTDETFPDNIVCGSITTQLFP